MIGTPCDSAPHKRSHVAILRVTNGSYNSKYGIVIPQKCIVLLPLPTAKSVVCSTGRKRVHSDSTVTNVKAPSSKHANSIELACLEDGAIIYVTVELATARAVATAESE